MNCNHNCFECQYTDCICDDSTFEELSEIQERDKTDQITKELEGCISRQRKWDIKNPDKARARKHKHYVENLETYAKRRKEYYKEHREEIIEKQKKYREQNIDIIKARERERKRIKQSDNPENKQKQREYRRRIKENLPHCDECTSCIYVLKDKGDGYRRLCVDEMRLIEQKVSNSPHWCKKRKKERKLSNDE